MGCSESKNNNAPRRKGDSGFKLEKGDDLRRASSLKNTPLDNAAKDSAEKVIQLYDIDNNGRLSRKEAQNWLRDTFEGLKRDGKLPQNMRWDQEKFEEAF